MNKYANPSHTGNRHTYKSLENCSTGSSEPLIVAKQYLLLLWNLQFVDMFFRIRVNIFPSPNLSIGRSEVAQGTGASFKFKVIDNVTPPHKRTR